MTGYVCIKDFDHVSIQESSVVVAVAAGVTDLQDQYKEGCVLPKKKNVWTSLPISIFGCNTHCWYKHFDLIILFLGQKFVFLTR